jgi:hypothetical protein
MKTITQLRELLHEQLKILHVKGYSFPKEDAPEEEWDKFLQNCSAWRQMKQLEAKVSIKSCFNQESSEQHAMRDAKKRVKNMLSKTR